MPSDTEQAFWDVANSEFAVARPEDDLLHPELNAGIDGDTATETQYLGFNIPEANIQALGYMWHHFNLGVVTGGIWVWRGHLRHNFQSEIFDFVTYENDSCLGGDLHKYELSNGYRVQTLDPLKQHRIAYSDPVRGNSLEVEFEAIMPPALMSDGLHFEQAMRTSGKLVLGDDEFEVDGFTVRDRSWAKLRPEGHRRHPPMSWINCGLAEDLAFGASAWDSLDTDPHWADEFELPGGKNLGGACWLWNGSEILPITSMKKRTVHDPRTLFPESCEISFEDSRGDAHELTAEMTSAANWRTWQNFDAVYCQAHWELDGRRGCGDFQEAQWHDYIKRHMKAEG